VTRRKAKVAQKNANDVAQKWSRNLSAATDSITKGVNAVTTAPSQAAIAQQAAMLAKLTASVQSGKWAKGLQRVDLQSWKTSMITKGVQRVASGAQTAEPKMQAFMTQWLPQAQAISDHVKQMPKMTIEDSVARVRYAMTQAQAFGKSRT
jgi:hypothetical protein